MLTVHIFIKKTPLLLEAIKTSEINKICSSILSDSKIVENGNLISFDPTENTLQTRYQLLGQKRC